MTTVRTRWAAIGAAVAITLGGGGLAMVDAAQGDGERSVYNPIEPCRLIDTRPNRGIGGRTAPLGEGEVLTVLTHDTSGECTGTPADITAVQLNITPVLPTEATDLTVWPSGDAPNASSLNPAPGQPPTPNAVTSEVTGSGEFRIRNKFGDVHLVIDLVGYYRDHHHDDRYQPGKIVPIDLRALHLSGSASHIQGGNVFSGVKLPDTGSPRFDFFFQLPRNYTPGDAINAEIWWHTDEAGCVGDIEAYQTSLARPGEVNGGFSMTQLPVRTSGSVPANTVRRNVWQLGQVNGMPFEPGDAISLDFSRISDECSNDLILDNIFVEYG